MKELKFALTLIVVAGDLLFLLWILYNGVASGFAGSLMVKLRFLSLMALLATNAILLLVTLDRQKST